MEDKTKRRIKEIKQRVWRERKKKIRSYAVVSRRYGKEIVLGEGLTKEAALDVGAKFTSQTLAASFKVKPSKKALIKRQPKTGLFKRLSSLGHFRPSKKDPLRIVERRKFRLNTQKEVSEIKMVKKTKRKRKRKIRRR